MPDTVVNYQIRMPPDLYDEMASWAEEVKASLNALVVELLQKALEVRETHGTRSERELARSR